MKITEGEFDKLAKSLSEVRLSATQKEQMLKGIYETEVSTPSPFVFLSFFSSQRMVATFAAFIFMLVGTGYAAADSLPGQFLYGIKVRVLEPVVLELTFEEEAQNGYKIHLLQKRVAEMRQLQVEAGINLEAQEASYYATERNVDDLETSAIFNEKGVNAKVNAQVETYNSLISKPFQIETSLLKTKESREKEETDETDEQEEISKAVEKVTEKTPGETEAVIGTAEGAVNEVEEVIKEVEITKPVEEVTAPVKEILGL